MTTDLASEVSPPSTAWCLFVELDGILLDSAPTPRAVRAHGALIDLLRTLHGICGGALAVVTGRPIADVDELLYPLMLPVAGIHGFERRNAQGAYFRAGSMGSGLSGLRDGLLDLARSLHGMLLEDKGCAFALHFRQAPHLEETVRLRMARLMTATAPTFELVEGDRAIEIKPVGGDKTTTVEAFMQEEPFAGRIPVYIGNDSLDVSGLAAARRFRGLGIGVGSSDPAVRRLAGPPEVRDWLLQLCKSAAASV